MQTGGSRSVEAAVGTYLEGRHALLVLDSLEHVLDAVPVVADWLAACSHLTILATSRAVLRTFGEYMVDIPPLSLPPAGPEQDRTHLLASEAVQLFIDRATTETRDAITEASATVAPTFAP